MKKYLVFIFFIAYSFNVDAQSPLNWSYTAKKIAGKTYEVHLIAKLQNGWHTYSQSTPEGGPVPTNISFKKNPLIIMSGNIKEVGKLIQKYEEVFGINVKYFSNQVDFVQTLKLKNSVKTSVSGIIEYMVCTDQQCLPPRSVSFTIALN